MAKHDGRIERTSYGGVRFVPLIGEHGFADDEAVIEGLETTADDSLDDLSLDPALPDLTIGDATIADWIRMTDDIDEACQAQIDYFRNHPLIPDEVNVHGHVYEVESDALRHPGDRVAEQINTRVAE